MASGDTLELTINHPTVGSKTFNCKGGEDVQIDFGGYTAERMVNGNATGHKSLSAKPWKIEGLSLEAMIGDGYQEFLQDVSNDPVDATITYSHINGSVYVGTGSVEADLKGSAKDGYIPCVFSGNGKLEKIA